MLPALCRTFAWAPVAFLLSLSSPAAAKPQQGGLPELYRIRIQNTEHGAVEYSFDKGNSWLVVARVAKAAFDRAPGAMANVPLVMRANANGIAIAIGNGKYIRLLPESPTNKLDPAAIMLNVGPGAGPFSALAPTLDSPIQLLMNMRPAPLPNDFLPVDGDILVITVGASTLKPEELLTALKLEAERYRVSADAAFERSKKAPARGLINLSIAVHPGEKPAAIVYKLDGDVLSIQNSEPFMVRQDTRKWTEGEHLIEVAALDRKGTTITRTTKLLYIKNRP
ncbi:MAG: hypothetical protein ABJA67_08475 [Chthonomonadales bacterium]